MSKYGNLLKNIQNWQNYFVLKFFRKTGEKVIFKTKNDIQLEVSKGDMLAIFKEIFMEDLYKTEFLKKIIQSPPKTVVDVGANVGFFTGFILDLYPNVQVIGFEPFPVNFKQFQKTIQLNPTKKIIAESQAVSGRDGITNLYFSAANEFTAIASTMDNFDTGNKNTLKVETVSLQTVLEKYKLQSINLLKLDCEGAEYDILYNASETVLSKIQVIVMEYHEGKKTDENAEYLTNFLKNAGFSVKSELITHTLWAWR